MPRAKSGVAMEMASCPVCGQEHPIGVLVHKQFKPIENQVTQIRMCPEHQALADKGYVALVGVAPEKSKPEQGVFYRTGEVMHMADRMFKEIFPGMEYPEGLPVCHVEQEVIAALSKAYERDIGEEVPGPEAADSIEDINNRPTLH